MAWLNRDLQKIILEHMEKTPNNQITPDEITYILFNRNHTGGYSLHEKYHEIANKLELKTTQPFKTPTFPDNDFAYRQGNTMHSTTLGKWKNVIHNNMVYLTGHKLLFNSHNYNFQITSKGIDFIQNDGGLSAILNVQTVKFHTDTINDMRNLLEAYIQNSDVSEEEKSKLSERMSQLSEEAIKICFTKLLEKGLENIPALGSFLWGVLLTLTK